MSDPGGQNEFQLFFESSLDLFCVAGLDGYFKRLNPAWQATLGYTVDELKARPFIEFVHPEDRNATLREVEQLNRGVETLRFENRYRTRNGGYRWLEWRATPFVETQEIIAVARDVTEQKALSEELLLLQRVTKAIGEAPDLDVALRQTLTQISVSAGWAYAEAWLADSHGSLSIFVPAWYAGRPDLEDFRRQSERIQIHPGAGLIGRAAQTKRVVWASDVESDEDFVRRRRLATWFGLRAAVAIPIVAGETVVAALAFFLDEVRPADQGFVDTVTAVARQLGQLIRRRQAEAELAVMAQRFEELSLVDDLTRLANRRAFLMHAEEKIRLAKRTHTPLTLLFVDVNDLKVINDDLGHGEGDRALTDTATVLQHSVRETDLAGRLGGDEFAVLLWGGDDAEGAVRRRLERALDELNGSAKRPYRLSISVGGTAFDPKRSVPLSTLVAEADADMYVQKRRRAATVRSSVDSADGA
ncbi:MAG TPA: diguanylate cyclase [Actinomycetota bacterium]|nr:diguanylate cyclase [Actinomycetota bacterium]